MVEGLIRKIWKEINGVDVEEIRVMPYQIAMDVVSAQDGWWLGSADPTQYGSDKPDTRFQNYVSLSSQSPNRIFHCATKYKSEPTRHFGHVLHLLT